MENNLIKIKLAPYRRITLAGVLCQRADDVNLSRADLPVPLTTAEGDQPSWNDLVDAAGKLNCRVEISDIRFIPKENDLHD